MKYGVIRITMTNDDFSFITGAWTNGKHFADDFPVLLKKIFCISIKFNLVLFQVDWNVTPRGLLIGTLYFILGMVGFDR